MIYCYRLHRGRGAGGAYLAGWRLDFGGKSLQPNFTTKAVSAQTARTGAKSGAERRSAAGFISGITGHCDAPDGGVADRRNGECADLAGSLRVTGGTGRVIPMQDGRKFCDLATRHLRVAAGHWATNLRESEGDPHKRQLRRCCRAAHYDGRCRKRTLAASTRRASRGALQYDENVRERAESVAEGGWISAAHSRIGRNTPLEARQMLARALYRHAAIYRQPRQLYAAAG